MFKAGDKVKYVGTYYNFNGYVGTVKEISDFVGVLFPETSEPETWPCHASELELVQ